MAETLLQGLKRFQASAFLSNDIAASDLRENRSPGELLKVLQDAVIPRLRSDSAVDDSSNEALEASLLDESVLSRAEWAEALAIHRLALLAIEQDHEGGLALLKDLHGAGIPRHRLYARYLGGAARFLGEQWEDDRKDFTDVTLATAYLQRLLREFSLLSSDHGQLAGQHHRILLVPASTEQHTLGLSVLGEVFRDAGWDVWGGPRIDDDELRELVGRERYDVVGLSIASERALPHLEAQIELIRAHSQNPSVRVLVGGQLINSKPEVADGLDADCVAGHGDDVVKVAAAAIDDGMTVP